MADEEIRRLFQRIDTAFDEYEQGYVDADATLRRLEGHIESLEETLETE